MSIGNAPPATDFDRWIATEFATGEDLGFTALIVLVRIEATAVLPVASSFAHVVGLEIDWGAVTGLLNGSGQAWHAAAFFPCRDPESGGPVDSATARLGLRELGARIGEDRLVLNEGHFFDAWGRRMRIEEVPDSGDSAFGVSEAQN